MKNYVAFIEDHSGSMSGLAQHALIDSNANMAAIANAASAVPVLPAVVGRTKPTPSPVPKAPVVQQPNVKWFAKRDDARDYARIHGGVVQGELRQFEQNVHTPQPRGPNGERWFVTL